VAAGRVKRAAGINDPAHSLFAPAMPLLAKETEVFPDDLFALPASGLRWRVAHVRSRQEKVLARYLLQRQVPYYLPQIERAVTRASRLFRSYLPLFAGYVFFRGGDDARDAAVRSGVTVQVIDTDDQELLAAQLSQLRELQLAGASLAIYEELSANDVVTITDGPFRGYTGAVVRGARGDRLVVSLSLLRKSVAVEFDRPVLRRARR
jgi:hypothetical protein